MENLKYNPFEEGFTRLVTLERFLFNLETSTVHSINWFLPNYNTVDPRIFPECLKRLLQYCRIISKQINDIKHIEILNESGVIFTTDVFVHDVNFIRKAIQVIVDFVTYCKKQIFWISINQLEQLVFVK